MPPSSNCRSVSILIVLAIVSCGAAFGVPEPSAPVAGTPGYVPVKDNLGVISGTVESEKGPIAGATVLIVSAKPRLPPQILEPLCYPDCLRSAVTDKAGSFSIAEIDGTLRYRLLVAKESYESKYVDNVDPRSDKRRISLRRSQFLEGKAELSGRIVDIDNRPVPAAAVIPRGYTRGDSGLEGPMEKIALAQITDSEGYFWIYTAQPVDSLTIEVRARICFNEIRGRASQSRQRADVDFASRRFDSRSIVERQAARWRGCDGSRGVGAAPVPTSAPGRRSPVRTADSNCSTSHPSPICSCMGEWKASKTLGASISCD